MNNPMQGNGRKLLGLVLIWASLIVGLALIMAGTDELRLSDAWQPDSGQSVLPKSDVATKSVPVWALCVAGVAFGFGLWFTPTAAPRTKPRRHRR